MGIVKFSKKFLKAHPNLYNVADDKILNKIVYYIIDSKYRKSVKLTRWLNEQVLNPSQKLLNIANTIKNGDYDKQVVQVLIWVKRNLKYTSDKKAWGMNEKWATANQIVETLRDDCDGGAVLTYVLCRLKGVPSNRLYVFAGNVEHNGSTSGHCWLGYKPVNYPLNFVFLDWCYYANNKSVDSRNKVYIKKRVIEGEPKYKTVWFGFNETKSFRTIN